VTGLLPEVVRSGLEGRSPFAASGSFGAVIVVLTLLLLVERELVFAASGRSARQAAVSAVVLPLLLTLALVIAGRITSLLPD